jgi:hypothetical protein
VSLSTFEVIRDVATDWHLSLSSTVDRLLQERLFGAHDPGCDPYYQQCPVPKPIANTDIRLAQRRDERRRMRTYLLRHQRCERDGCPNPSVAVHHKTPKRMGGTQVDALHREGNFEALCLAHHHEVHGIRDSR